MTLTAGAGTGYAVSSTQASASVAVADDDDPPKKQTPPPVKVCRTADAALLARVAAKAADPWGGARPDLLETFTRSHNTMLGADDYTVADLKARPDRQQSNWQGAGPNELWQKIYTELDRLQACRAAPTPDTPPRPPVVPVVSVTAGAGVTEGGAAVFTATATPAPSAALSVTVTVAQTGDFGVTTGSRTVVIPTTGSAQLSVATVGDNIDEPINTSIANDDQPPPVVGASLSMRDAEVSENGRFLRFMVYLSETPDETVTVQVTTRDGTAEHGADYRGYATPSRTLRFSAGTRLLYRYIYIPILDDDTPEGDETFQVILTNPVGAAIARGTATITIKDND